MTETSTAQSSIYDFKVKRLNGDEEALSQYQGKVLLIINTASKCGFTDQYAGLEALHQELSNEGLQVLGFPCNQFGAQEPGSHSEIQAFCQKNYGVTFPLFEKIDVNGDNAHPLFVFLKKQAPGLLGSEAIKWNFTKFLVDRSGVVVDRFGPQTKPESIKKDIQKLLELA